MGRKVSSYSQIAEARWFRDVVLPAEGETVQVTPSGDWPTVAGRANLHDAHRRRAVTTPGEMVHRPQYGGGLVLGLERPNTEAMHAQLAASLRSNALRDPRLGDIEVDVNELDASRVLTELVLHPRGEPQTDTVSIVSEV